MNLEDAKMCDHCQVQHDSADIYEVDGENICLECWQDMPSHAPE